MAEMIRQFTVQLENKPDRLAHVCSNLAKEKLNLTAVTVANHHDRGVLRLVTDNMSKTRKVLATLNVPFQEDDVLLVPMTNRPGALAHVCERLAEERINIDYAYSSATGQNGKSIGIFKTSNPIRSLKLLAAPRPKLNGWSRKGRKARSAEE
ncbi:MAG TPA: hypothetical protein PKD86_07970 [Gemmatales bacterium]|mgnify:CR=1 FL=1|nr:hypothetical protein [Gemmatales bacterium]HMP59275.1 hypothetical protein [Gemmatales bacterium]